MGTYCAPFLQRPIKQFHLVPVVDHFSVTFGLSVDKTRFAKQVKCQVTNRPTGIIKLLEKIISAPDGVVIQVEIKMFGIML